MEFGWSQTLWRSSAVLAEGTENHTQHNRCARTSSANCRKAFLTCEIPEQTLKGAPNAEGDDKRRRDPWKPADLDSSPALPRNS